MKIRISSTLSLIVIFCCALATGAQQQAPKVEAFGSDSPERGTTRVGYWDNVKKGGAGQLAIDYGKPVWRKEYEDTGKFDLMTRGRVWRLGSNFWTALDTDVPIRISGQAVPAGYWFLGLKRSSDGATWTLAFIDPQKVKEARLDASEIGKTPIAFEAPISLEKSSQTKERLTIDLIIDKTHIYQPTLKIAWGNLSLSAPIEVESGS
ncbi:MAG TPA: DUF2911 domain-containing protein [Blastocatellia bacterium]